LLLTNHAQKTQLYGIKACAINSSTGLLWRQTCGLCSVPYHALNCASGPELHVDTIVSV